MAQLTGFMLLAANNNSKSNDVFALFNNDIRVPSDTLSDLILEMTKASNKEIKFYVKKS